MPGPVMRAFSLIPSLLLTVSIPAMAAIQTGSLQMADWHVAPRSEAGAGEPDYCALASRYEGGPIVTYTRNAQAKGAIAVDFPNAAMEPGQRYAVTLISPSRTQSYAARAVSTTQLVFQTGYDPALADALASGQDLTIRLDGTPGVYSLAGNTRAFAAFNTCVQTLRSLPVLNNPIVTAAAPIENMVMPQNAPPPVLAVNTVPAVAAIIWDKPAAVVQTTTVTEDIVVTSVKPAAVPSPPPLQQPGIQAALHKRPDMKTLLWDKPVTEQYNVLKPELHTANPSPVIGASAPARQPFAQTPLQSSVVLWDVRTPSQDVTSAALDEDNVSSTPSELKSRLSKARAQAKGTSKPGMPSFLGSLLPVQNPPAKETGIVPLPVPTPVPKMEKAGTAGVPVLPSAPAPPSVMPPAMPPAIPAKPGKVVTATTETIVEKTVTAPAVPLLATPPVPAPLARSDNKQVANPIAATASKPVAPLNAPQTPVAFRPAPAAATSTWKARSLGASTPDKSDDFCLMENRFANDATLLIGQRSDGFSTLGLNYGIDMLQPGRQYAVNVKVDNTFDEDFNGVAEDGKTLVIQMGKKASFFAALPHAQAMRIAMPGAASSFALQGVPATLDAFSNCVVSLGGQSLAQASLPPLPVTAIEKVIETPLDGPNSDVPKAMIRTTQVIEEQKATTSARPVPQPVPPPKPVGEIVKVEDKTSVTSLRTKTPPKTKDSILWDKAKPTPSEAVASLPTPAKPALPLPAKSAPVASAPVSAQDEWQSHIRAVLGDPAVNLKPRFTPKGDSASWSKGVFKGETLAIANKDILDATSDALDEAQKSCTGAFNSQMGLPEPAGDSMIQSMESKCAIPKGASSVTAWIGHQQGNHTELWSIQAPREQRREAFQLRDTLVKILQDKKYSTPVSSKK